MNAKLRLTWVAVSLALAAVLLAGCQATQKEPAAAQGPAAAPAPPPGAPPGAPPPPAAAPAAKKTPAKKATPAPGPPPPTEGSKAPFNVIDKDGNGKLTREEWTAVMPPPRFSEFDKDGDGTITKAEYEK